MDPASAVIGIVAFGFTVFGKVNEMRTAVKGASQQVQALQDTSTVVELLLIRLQTIKSRESSYTAAELVYLEKLCARSRFCLQEVETVV